MSEEGVDPRSLMTICASMELLTAGVISLPTADFANSFLFALVYLFPGSIQTVKTASTLHKQSHSSFTEK